MITDLVSTIIPVYNRPGLLQEAVGSVLAQTWRPIEVIISDDGSTDETPEKAAQLVSVQPDSIRYVRNENRGPGPAREAGRQLARGEFIQYLDSDDRLLPDKFTLQIAALRANPECGVAYGYTRLIDANGQVLRAPFKWTGEDRETLFPGLLVDRWWCTHTPLYRLSVTDKVGAWSDLRYSQDWDYDARVGALGTRLVNCHAWVSEHRHHDAVRQTGKGKWLDRAGQARFFTELYLHATEAGVSASAPEMKHFSRWVFHHARECGQLGDAITANALLALAHAAAGPHARDIKGFRWLVQLIGWRNTTRLANTASTLRLRRNGGNTLRQAWMD